MRTGLAPARVRCSTEVFSRSRILESWWKAVTCQGMSGDTDAMNCAASRSSSSESLKPGMTSVTISSQNPLSHTILIESRMVWSSPPSFR